MTNDPERFNCAPDLLYGMQAVADFLGIKRSVAYHLAATHRIPTFKIGKTVCARRSKILAALEALETTGHRREDPSGRSRVDHE